MTHIISYRTILSVDICTVCVHCMYVFLIGIKVIYVMYHRLLHENKISQVERVYKLFHIINIQDTCTQNLSRSFNLTVLYNKTY
jgi:hypothetical protein